jgi:hypothetical protein
MITPPPTMLHGVPEQALRERKMRGLWKSPRSRAWWLWLLTALALYAIIAYMYSRDIKSYGLNGPPGLGPLAKYGIAALGVALLTSTYTLRRRFMRFLPWQARSWLWMHNWLGVTALLIAMLHANFVDVLHNYCLTPSCLASENAGPLALYGLILLVGCGIAGRLIDRRQTRVIARDASTNGAGIAQALEERIRASSFAVERLYAGKSEPFQRYCISALEDDPLTKAGITPALPLCEQADFQRAVAALIEHARLLQSRQRQQRARLMLRRWRVVHIALACLAACMIGMHLGILVIAKLGILRRL